MDQPTSPSPLNQEDLRDFRRAKPLLDQLVSVTGPVEQSEEAARRLRANRVDTKAMEASGDLSPGQTYIGVGLIRQNIRNALPPLLAYLKNSPRMATFAPGGNDYLDQEFTRVLQYPAWEVDYIRTLDSAEQNGLGFMLVMHDETKLGNVAMENIRYSWCIYDRRVEDIQDSPAVLLKRVVTSVSFYDWHVREKFDENSAAFKAIIEVLKTQAGQAQQEVSIYETYFKINGIVHRAWYYALGDGWLKAPEVFSNGVMERVAVPPTVDPNNPQMLDPQQEWRPSPRVQYPVAQKFYEISAEMRNELLSGRAQDDYHKQEAVSSLWTAMVNGSLQASHTMWSDDGETPDGGAPKQLSLKIKNGQVWNKRMRAFNAPYPDPQLMKAADAIITQNAQETAQVAWAVNNRKDTRKTAAEIKAAEGMQQQLTSSDALVFSIFLRQVFTLAWPVIRSAAMQGKINFLPDMSPEDKQTVYSKVFEIKPAGDVDFIEKQQRMSNLREDMGLFAGSPLMTEMQLEYIRLRYPEKYEMWSKMLRQNDQAKQLIQALGESLKEAVTTPDGQLKPEFQPEAENLQILEKNVATFLQPPVVQ